MATRPSTKKAKVLHREVYRGVGFGINESANGSKFGYPDRIEARYGHFCRYIGSKEEAENPTPESMRQAIDNMLSGNVIYKGDLRDQWT